MNEIIKEYICRASCKIVINKLQKVLTYIICQQMDEMPHWHFVHHIGMWVGIFMWRLVAKKLHIVACELHYVYDIVYNIGCPLQLLQLVW